MCMHMHDAYVEDRGLLWGIDSLLPPCECGRYLTQVVRPGIRLPVEPCFQPLRCNFCGKLMVDGTNVHEWNLDNKIRFFWETEFKISRKNAFLSCSEKILRKFKTYQLSASIKPSGYSFCVKNCCGREGAGVFKVASVVSWFRNCLIRAFQWGYAKLFYIDNLSQWLFLLTQRQPYTFDLGFIPKSNLLKTFTIFVQTFMSKGFVRCT